MQWHDKRYVLAGLLVPYVAFGVFVFIDRFLIRMPDLCQWQAIAVFVVSMLTTSYGLYYVREMQRGRFMHVMGSVLLGGVLTICNVFFVWLFAIAILFMTDKVFI